MNVQDAVRELSHKSGAQHAHVPGEADQVHVIIPQLIDERAVVGFPVHAAGGQGNRVNTALARYRKAAGIGPVADYDGDIGFERTPGGIVRNRLEI